MSASAALGIAGLSAGPFDSMLLSVCIPTWNRSAFIRLSARYWLEQMTAFTDRVELVIADNASKDDTVAQLESLRDLGPFRLIRRPENVGFNRSTFDLVARQAQGGYVWVCGDDDYLNPGALAGVMEALEKNQDLDHFYVPTQFVPADHPPDLAREDPRESPHLHRPAGEDPTRLVPRTQEILEADPAAFTGFYSSIWRRALAVEALSGDFEKLDPFTSLEATLPYAVFVARRRLGKPCGQIKGPVLTVVHTISWPQYASLFRLKIMPDLFDLYRAQGLPDRALRSPSLELMDHWPRAFIDLFRRRGSLANGDFSFAGFLARRFYQARFWKELGRYLWCDLLP